MEKKLHVLNIKMGNGLLILGERFWITIILLLWLNITLTACIPSREIVRKADAATVVNAISGAPIADAKVIVESWQLKTPTAYPRDRKDVFATYTNADGRFYIPEMKKWAFGLPVPDTFPSFGRRLCIEKEGYIPTIDPVDNPGFRQNFLSDFPSMYRLMPSDQGATCPFGHKLS